MALDPKTKTRKTILTLMLFIAGLLSACSGGNSDSIPQIPSTPPTPPVQTTPIERIGLDVQLSSNTPSYATGDSLKAFITEDKYKSFIFSNQGQLPFDYKFTFPTGFGTWLDQLLPIAPNGVGFFDVKMENYRLLKFMLSNKNVLVLEPKLNNSVQNVVWTDTQDRTLFGLSAAGFAFQGNAQNLPSDGTTYKGKAFQHIVDSSTTAPTTYALFTSDVTAVVDHSTIAVTVGPAMYDVVPNELWGGSANAAVLKEDPTQFAVKYELTNLNLSSASFPKVISSPQLPASGFGLGAKENGLEFFGNNAEEMGGFIHYSGQAPDPNFTRDQFISFTLVKQK